MTRKKDELKNTRQFRRYNKTEEYIKIEKNFCSKWELDPTSAIIYKVIERADTLEQGCYCGSVQNLSVITFTSRNTVVRALKGLIDRGFIAKVKITTQNGKITAYKNLGTDCTVPEHIGKPFTIEEKLKINKTFVKEIIEKWIKDKEPW